MPQTRFVLRKALDLEKKVIVVVNKIDRPAARCAAAGICGALPAAFTGSDDKHIKSCAFACCKAVGS